MSRKAERVRHCAVLKMHQHAAVLVGSLTWRLNPRAACATNSQDTPVLCSDVVKVVI